MKFDRSTDQGNVNDFGEMERIVSKTRTSSNAWCTGICERQPGEFFIRSRFSLGPYIQGYSQLVFLYFIFFI